jgi:hemerythrin-like metal-binding protein
MSLVTRSRPVKDIEWSYVLSIDVEEIDEDHRKLASTFNTLNHAVAEGEPREYLAAVLDELIHCTVWHFSHEERLMLKHGYPDLEAHKSEHQDLIKSARELQQEILEGGGTVAEKHMEFLERWLTEHILTTDMELGNYLSQKM